MKPDNVVLVEQDGDRDFAKVLDFGIAMLRGDVLGKAGGEQLTRAGMTMGTPAYLSPEQAFARDVDARTDLYALSAMLFEMLAGRPPFVADDPLEILSMQTTAEVPRLSAVAPGLVLPAGLEELIRRGLAKKREERVASADELLAELARIGGETAGPRTAILAAPSPPRWSPRVLWGRLSRAQRIAVGVGAGLLLLLVIAGATSGGTGGGFGVGVNVDERLAGLTAKLESAETCEARREAVLGLQGLGDPRAIPALKKARYRMRGGIAGFGDTNTNGCLRKDAEAAIKVLEARR
jgi:hypothetical protein